MTAMKKHWGLVLICCLQAVGCRVDPVAREPTAAVPASEGCPAGKAVVSLTYDDGLASQLENAVPALDRYRFRGTFFLNDVSKNPRPWRAVKGAGHELAGHTLKHPCTAAFDWVTPENASEVYTPERMAEELDRQIAALESLGQGPPVTFAYPCGTTWIGREHKSYVAQIEERFTAARGVDGRIITNADDMMNVGAYFIEGPTDRLIQHAQEAIDANGWVVFGFHGVGGDHLPISNEDHQGFLDWLDAHREKVIVLPFGEAARCIEERYPAQGR